MYTVRVQSLGIARLTTRLHVHIAMTECPQTAVPLTAPPLKLRNQPLLPSPQRVLVPVPDIPPMPPRRRIARLHHRLVPHVCSLGAGIAILDTRSRSISVTPLAPVSTTTACKEREERGDQEASRRSEDEPYRRREVSRVGRRRGGDEGRNIGGAVVDCVPDEAE